MANQDPLAGFDHKTGLMPTGGGAELLVSSRKREWLEHP